MTTGAERRSPGRGRSRGKLLPVLLASAAAATLTSARTAHAWLFVEHTEIGRSAFSTRTDVGAALEVAQLGALQQAWQAVRDGGNTGKADLCPMVGAPESPLETPPRPSDAPFATCVDLPMLAAIAGDHSCGAEDLTATLRSDWLGDLIAMFRDNYAQIRREPLEPPARRSVWHAGHLAAQRIDDLYLSRAAQGGAHFVLPRETRGERPEDLREYVRRMADLGSPTSAVGLYLVSHARALREATLAGCKPGAICANAENARNAVLFEAVALHFLEDAFASGHVVGVPEDTSKASRLGTHDYYCEHGLSTTTWSGTTYAAFGDAHLRRVDRLQTANTVRRSLAQVADALRGAVVSACADLVAVDVCQAATLPGVAPACVDEMVATLGALPVPAQDAAPLPAFRDEVGAFVRFSAGVYGGIGGMSAGVAASDPRQPLPTWGLRGAMGGGVSLAGVTTASSDATAFVEVGLDAVSGQRTEWCFNCSLAGEPVDTRLGYGVRVRMPFWAVPGDFVLIGAAAAFWKPAYNLLVWSAEGGLYGRVERVHDLGERTSWQIMLGREVEFDSYSFPGPSSVVKSIAFTVPAVEAQWRTFSDIASVHPKLQLGYRVEHSDVVTAHFAVLSINADTNLYFTGF